MSKSIPHSPELKRLIDEQARYRAILAERNLQLQKTERKASTYGYMLYFVLLLCAVLAFGLGVSL